MNDPTAASHSTEEQTATSDALQALVGSSKRGRDTHKPTDGRDVMDGSDSTSPYQDQEESSAGENRATPSAPIQTLGSDTSENLADGGASSSEDCRRGKWKRTFHMVIHLSNDNHSIRVTCLDTGADINVISIDVVDSLHLAKEPYQGPPLKPIGGTYLPEWQVRFDWHVAQHTKTYTSIFAVLDKDHSADFDILVGKETVEDIEFYKVNSRVWFDDEAELATGNDGTPLGFPSIEVEKGKHGEDGPSPALPPLQPLFGKRGMRPTQTLFTGSNDNIGSRLSESGPEDSDRESLAINSSYSGLVRNEKVLKAQLADHNIADNIDRSTESPEKALTDLVPVSQPSSARELDQWQLSYDADAGKATMTTGPSAGVTVSEISTNQMNIRQ
ncbi:MAG: hypothetical protein Q9180_008931, partial [Flavoplaca navasiana]